MVDGHIGDLERYSKLCPVQRMTTHLPSAESPSSNEKCNVSGPKKSARTVQVANQSANIPDRQRDSGPSSN